MKKFIAFLTAAAIVYEIFSPFRLYFGGGKALALLIPSVVIIIYDALFMRKSFVPMALFISTCFILMFNGSDYFSIPFLIKYVFAYASLEHFLVKKDYTYVKIVGVAFYASLMVMVAISLPLFISIPNLSRTMLAAEENGITTPIMFWTIAYSTIHELPVYIIPLFYFYKRAGQKVARRCSLIAVLMILALLFFADSTGALILGIIVFLILIIYKQNRNLKYNITRMSLLGVFAFVALNETILVGLLSLIQPIFSGSSIYKKIDEFIFVIQGKGTSGDLELREEMANISKKSFMENPLGPELNTEKIGHHNFLFDQIVALGLLLSITFVWFLIERIRRPLRYLNNNNRIYYLTAILALLILGLFKNYFLLFPSCSLVPMILIAFENNKKISIRL